MLCLIMKKIKEKLNVTEEKEGKKQSEKNYCGLQRSAQLIPKHKKFFSFF